MLVKWALFRGLHLSLVVCSTLTLSSSNYEFMCCFLFCSFFFDTLPLVFWLYSSLNFSFHFSTSSSSFFFFFWVFCCFLFCFWSWFLGRRLKSENPRSNYTNNLLFIFLFLFLLLLFGFFPWFLLEVGRET